MKSDQSVRWVRLAIRVAVAVIGSYLAAQASGGKGAATYLPALLAGLTTLEAGLSQSPSGPVEATIVNPKSDPANVQEVKKP